MCWSSRSSAGRRTRTTNRCIASCCSATPSYAPWPTRWTRSATSIWSAGSAPTALTVDELDTVLGVVLETSDADFNAILERGFAAAIRREWAWRTSRGDSVKNLAAFRHLIDDPLTVPVRAGHPFPERIADGTGRCSVSVTLSGSGERGHFTRSIQSRSARSVTRVEPTPFGQLRYRPARQIRFPGPVTSLEDCPWAGGSERHSWCQRALPAAQCRGAQRFSARRETQPRAIRRPVDVRPRAHRRAGVAVSPLRPR